MLKKKIIVILTAVTGLAITPIVCLANAFGLARWGGFVVEPTARSVTVPISIPAGVMEHFIIGEGYRIDAHRVYYVSGGHICDPSIQYTYGYGARKTRSAIARGCWRNKAFIFNPGGAIVPRGNSCAELWANEWRVLVAKQCHFIED
jgi:hypothetical protein